MGGVFVLYKIDYNVYKHGSYVLTSNGKVIDIGDDFLELTGYTKEDILYKSMSEVCNELLRITIDLYDTESSIREKEGFIFTKSLEVREISLSVTEIISTNEKIYYIVEKPNSRLEDKFPYVEQIFLDNKYGICVYSKDLILLKANDIFLSNFDEPFNKRENIIGLKINKIKSGFENSNYEKILYDTFNVIEAYHTSEYIHGKSTKGSSYWESSITPIFENGKVKYLTQKRHGGWPGHQSGNVSAAPHQRFPRGARWPENIFAESGPWS